MVRLGEDEVTLDDGERMARTSDQARSGWEQTLEDLEVMIAEREEAGFETFKVVAGDTTPKPPKTGQEDEWGLSYVVPSNNDDELRAFIERATFDETAVYQASVGGYMFIVTECIDTAAEATLFIAGSYELRFASDLVRTAMEEGTMFSLLKKLDGTLLGTIEHDDPEAFFPDPDMFYSYDVEY